MKNPALALATTAVVASSLVLTIPDRSWSQTPAEAACRAAVAKSVSKYVNKALQTVEKCHKNRNKGSLPLSTSCNDITVADTKDKLEAQRDRVREDVETKCGAVPSLITRYARCPSPAADADDGETTDGIDSFAELAECMIALADAEAGLAGREVLGLPAAKPSSTGAKCHKELGKGLRKIVKMTGKVRSKCQKELDGQGAGLEYGCTGEDAKDKISKTIAKVKNGIGRRCILADPRPASAPNEALDALDSCGDTTEQLGQCVADTIAARLGSGLIAMTYELRSTCQAGTVHRSIVAGAGEELSATELNTGWSGQSHGADVPDRTGDAVVVDCDDDCANCDVRLHPLKDDPRSFCRCQSDSTASCDVINGPDPDDCTGGIGGNTNCICNFGSPLPLSAGNTPACVVNHITENYSGSVDIGRGIWSDVIHLASLVHLGLSTTQPCPICVGDTGRNDGIRDGTCQGLLASGACDVNGDSLTFGPTSFDCLPQQASNVSGGGLVINLSFSTGTQTLPGQLPCDQPPGSLCPCRVCTGDTNVGCTANADCEAVNAGTCTGGGGAGVQPNECTGFLCGADGKCVNGPTLTYCDGITRANGNGYISCASNADCDSLQAGTCTLSQGLRCFPEPIVVTGSPGPFGPTAASHFCIPPTTAFPINTTAGLPGPGTFIATFEVDVRCAEDESIPFEPPAGINCPAVQPPGSTTTTTLLPALGCNDQLPPTCGLATDCPLGEICQSDGESCSCEPGLLACGDSSFPLCAIGSCPVGQTCQGSTIGQPCSCMPE